LFTVFAGLLFSCGEGVRLFPFPLAEIGQKDLSPLKDGKEPNYQENIHRFENKQENYQSKIEDGEFPDRWAHFISPPFYLKSSGISFSPDTYLSFNHRTFKSRFFCGFCGGRAPPVS
jgi:hypothetical protein